MVLKDMIGKEGACMAFASKTTKEKTRQEWVLERKEIAKQQLLRVPALIEALFRNEDLTSYLQLLSRMPYYGYQNLLIIHDKYPAATVLAGFPVWQRIMASEDSSQKVLKPEAVKNGIDLVVPFTNMIGEQDYELTWYSVLMFDIRQTNVKNISLRKPVYIQDANHRSHLLNAIATVLGSHYGRRIAYDSQSNPLLASGTKGRISDRFVTVARGLKDDEHLSWLTEVLCELATDTNSLSQSTLRLLGQCMQFCLYEMWGLQHPGILTGAHLIVPADERAAFLDILQKSVFTLHQYIAGAYLSERRDAEEDVDDIDPALSRIH